jgi:hypothetical protein
VVTESWESVAVVAHKVTSSPKHVKRKLQATSIASILIRSGDNMIQSTYVRVYQLEHISQPYLGKWTQQVGNCDPWCKQRKWFSETYEKAAAARSTFM